MPPFIVAAHRHICWTIIWEWPDRPLPGAAAEIEWLRAAIPDRDSTVIDLGAGTGQFSLLAAQQWSRVVAVDPSPVMLRELRRKVAAADASVTVVEGGYLTFEWPAGTADLVYSRYALHHLPDFWKALALDRMRAMRRPGRVLRLWDVVYNFPVSEAVDRIEQWCRRDAKINYFSGELDFDRPMATRRGVA